MKTDGHGGITPRAVVLMQRGLAQRRWGAEEKLCVSASPHEIMFGDALNQESSLGGFPLPYCGGTYAHALIVRGDQESKKGGGRWKRVVVRFDAESPSCLGD